MKRIPIQVKIFLAVNSLCALVLLFSLGILDEGTVYTLVSFGIPIALISFGVYATSVQIKSFRKGEIKFDEVVLATIPMLIGILHLFIIIGFLYEFYW